MFESLTAQQADAALQLDVLQKGSVQLEHRRQKIEKDLRDERMLLDRESSRLSLDQQLAREQLDKLDAMQAAFVKERQAWLEHKFQEEQVQLNLSKEADKCHTEAVEAEKEAKKLTEEVRSLIKELHHKTAQPNEHEVDSMTPIAAYKDDNDMVIVRISFVNSTCHLTQRFDTRVTSANFVQMWSDRVLIQ